MKLVLKIAAGIILASISLWIIGIILGAGAIAVINEGLKEELKTTRPPTNLINPTPRQNTPHSPKPVWIPGKPLSQCVGPDNTLNAAVLRCRDGYWTNSTLKRTTSQYERKQNAIAQAKRTCNYWREQWQKERTTENRKMESRACQKQIEIISRPANNF